jgi:NADH-quinone oxidoreductase subunit M
MQQYLISLLIFLPAVAAFIALFIPAEQSNGFKYLTLVVNLIQFFVLVAALSIYEVDQGIQLVEKQPWITLSLGTWGVLKAEYFVGIDGLSLPLVALSVFVMTIATISSWTINKNIKGYFILLLILNAAIIGSFTALDLLLFYLFFEFMLLPMFFLIAIWGGERREYASIKFFLYTLLGSILILIVIIGLYVSVHDQTGGPGTLVHSFNMLNMMDPSNFVSNSILDPNNSWQIGIYNARQWAFLFLFIGFAIKLPTVPFHTWLPDAHVEAPTPVSVILAALLLKIGGYGLIRIAFPIFPEAALYFTWFVGIMGVISIVYGALNAMASKDLKRLIAYSSVSHMGFVLLGVASVTSEGVSGAIYQMFSHGIISAMLFVLVGVIYDRTHDRTISYYSGLSEKMKAFTAFVLIGFFASMGLPGFSGFIAEILVFLGAFKAPSTNGLLHEAFAIVATSGLVLGAAYYLWTLQRMFFGPFDVKGQIDPSLLTDINKREYVMLIPMALAALLFGIFPQPIIGVIDPFARYFSELVLLHGKNLTLTP